MSTYQPPEKKKPFLNQAISLFHKMHQKIHLCLRNNNAHISPNHVEIRNKFHGKVKNRYHWAFTDYDNETRRVLLDLFLPATEMSKVRATETDACFLTTFAK
jgi:hypothetical protein